MADTPFDVVIIGSGPGGYVAAIRAAQLGFKTAIVEKAYLGGICLNWGCIPTKALLRSAEIYHYMQHAKDYETISADNVSFDPKAVVQRSRGVSKRLNDGVGFLMRKNKVSVIWGEAAIDAPGKFTVKATTEAPKGALGRGLIRPSTSSLRPAHGRARCRVSKRNGKLVWTYFEAMIPERIPKSLLVVGSGAIGVEFASFFRTMGAEVTVVEVLPQILPVEDAEVAAFARKSFEKQGIKILTGAKVTKLDKKSDSVVATIDDGKGKTQTIKADQVSGRRRRRQRQKSRA